MTETDGVVSTKMANGLQILTYAMAASLFCLAVLGVWLHAGSAGRAPRPESLRLVNLLTTAAMMVAAAAIAASEGAWRYFLRRAAGGPIEQRAWTAYIARAGLREGAAMAGLVVILLAAPQGVLPGKLLSDLGSCVTQMAKDGRGGDPEGQRHVLNGVPLSEEHTSELQSLA
jgi:hypothetical protein